MLWRSLSPGIVREGNSAGMVRAGGSFVPNQISGLAFWFDATQISGLNDGDPVGTWTDLSGNGRSATQGTTSKKPVYKVGIQNGNPAVLCDGVDDDLVVTYTPAAATTVFIVAKRTGTAGSTKRFWGWTSTASVFDNSGAWAYFENEANGVVAIGGNTGNIGILCINYASLSSATYALNGAVATAFDPKDTYVGPTSLVLGAESTSANFINAYLFEVIAYGASLTTTDQNRVRDYLNRKWAAY